MLLAVALLSHADSARSRTPTARLVRSEGPPVEASLAAIDYDAARPRSASFRFVVDQSEPIEASGFVRWGSPSDAVGPAALRATDGSLLVSDRVWSASGYLRVDHDSISLHRQGGWVAIQRPRALRATLEAVVHAVDRSPVPQDAVRLLDGDRLEGEVLEVTRSKLALRLSSSDDAIDVPIDRVAAIRFAGAELREPRACCLIGLADGSVLRARRVRSDAQRLSVVSHSGIAVDVNPQDVVFAQTNGGTTTYLSDLEPVDYRHTPYFDLTWPYASDAALDGGPLRAGGRRHSRGLAVRSASRLVYRLDGGEARFQAEAAIADQAAEGIGSVVFRVYLVRDERVEPAFTSAVVRGGDPPTPIDVDATDASALVLVVDYADEGDSGDEALWIDARLVAAE